MKVQCKICGIHVEAPAGCEGKRLRCPECGGVFVASVPRALPAEEVQPAPAAGEPVLLEDVLEAAPPAEGPGEERLIELAEEVTERPADVLAEMGHERPRQVVRPSARQWHVLVAGVPAVALTYEELCRKAAAGEIRPRTKVHYVPRDLTMRAGDVPGLFPDQAPKPAAPARGQHPSPPPGGGEADALARALEATGSGADVPAVANDADKALRQLGSAAEAEHAGGAAEGDEALKQLGRAVNESEPKKTGE